MSVRRAMIDALQCPGQWSSRRRCSSVYTILDLNAREPVKCGIEGRVKGHYATGIVQNASFEPLAPSLLPYSLP